MNRKLLLNLAAAALLGIQTVSGCKPDTNKDIFTDSKTSQTYLIVGNELRGGYNDTFYADDNCTIVSRGLNGAGYSIRFAEDHIDVEHFDNNKRHLKSYTIEDMLSENANDFREEYNRKKEMLERAGLMPK